MKIKPKYGTPEFLTMATAVHETSHAVLATALGHQVTKVEISGIAGDVVTKKDNPGFEGMIFAVGGWLGEAQWYARHYWVSQREARATCVSNGCEWDLDLARTYSKQCGRSMRCAEAEATRLLKTHRGKIERLARKLASNGSLSPFWDL